MNVTRHAADRTHERLGVPKKSADKIAAKAFECGIRREEIRGSLRRYLDHLYSQHYTANNIRVFTYYIYIFCEDTLVTVEPLPQKYRNTVDKMRRK